MAALIVQEEEVERAFRRERLFRDREHPLKAYSEEEVVKKYRFSREGILHIMGLLGEDTLNHPTARNHALAASSAAGHDCLKFLCDWGCL